MNFADCSNNYEIAKFVIVGIPFDSTSSYRKGSKLAPLRIRESSYSLESYDFYYNLDFSKIPVYDWGDIEEVYEPETLINLISELQNKLLKDNKFPIFLGGEHTLTIGAVKPLPKDTSIVILDAHLDYRNEYCGIKWCHTCTTKRVSEIVSENNVLVIGVRSMSYEEKAHNISVITAKNFVESLATLTLKNKIYLSIDLDVIDIAYAPAVGNPEPYGLTPENIRHCIEKFAPYLIGCDICEYSPLYDNGNTGILAAKFVQNIVMSVYNAQK